MCKSWTGATRPIGIGKPVAAGLDETVSGDSATVAVIIPTFNHSRFLAEAITSVLKQRRPADEIIVVDDGSTDNPEAVVTQFQGVRLIRQDNRGLSAARNTGLRSCTTSHVIFLDADDRLLPAAIEAGLACIATRPDCAFVYGGYRRISEDGCVITADIFNPIEGDAHLALLRRNLIGPPIAVLFRRDCLLAVNGFDETLRRCEDYDAYLRITERYQIASHPEIVFEYRRHGDNMSDNHVEQLKTTITVLDRQEARIVGSPLTQTALREGRAHIRKYSVSQILDAASARWRARHDIDLLARDLIKALRWSPYYTLRRLLGFVGRRARGGNDVL